MSALVVRDVSKRFRLYHERPSSLKERIVRRARSRYDELWALRDVSLAIEPGTSFGLIGHNGSGKSTLLKLMAGIYQATSGSIESSGRIAALIELGAGFHPELTGRENVYLNGSIMGLSNKEIDKRFDSIVEFSGLAEFIDNPVKVYSSGMYVRLGFAVAVNVRPDVLLVDEVIAVGDEEFQRRCMEHIYRLKRDGCTIVFVSHSLPTVQTLCDRAAWLDHGRVVSEGRPVDVCDSYLDHVDDQGAARGEQPSQGRPARGRRVEILGVEFIGPDGRPTLTAVTGEPMTLRMHYRAGKPLEGAAFFFGFHTESGVHIAEPSTHHTSLDGITISGEGVIDYHLEQLPLLAGTYLVSASIWDRDVTQPHDYRDRSLVLQVRKGQGGRQNGVLDLGGEWTASEP